MSEQEQVARRFIDALHKLERDRDLDAIVATFADACDVGNVVSPRTFEGKEGAREFWTIYRDTLGEVESTFRNVIATGGRAALEWTTRGTGANGHPIDYDGVSILEIEGDAITRFRAYFNPAELGEQIKDG
jgi:limonene-1,2-epoxide hydrolase